jgi:hypothetical protein
MKWLIKASFFIAVFTAIDTKLLLNPTLWLHYIPMLILLPIFLYKYGTVPLNFLLFGFIFLLVGFIEVQLGNNTFPLLFKVLFGLLFNFVFFHYLLKYFHFNVHIIFSYYIKGAIFISVVLILQVLFYKLGFKPGYDFSYIGVPQHYEWDGSIAPGAFFTEPFVFATVVSPALFIAIHNLVKFQKNFMSYTSCIIVITAVILATSSVGYFAFFLCIIMIIINYRAILILFSSIIFGIGCFLFIYTTSEKFRVRFDDSVEVFIKNNVTNKTLTYNVSTMTLYNNMLIATDNFRDHPLTGTGLGSHFLAHAHYGQFDDKLYWPLLNKEDANSLFLRLLSETGLLGLGLMATFIFRFLVTRNRAAQKENWLISNGLLVLILVSLMRQGNYMLFGLPLFILCYYYIAKENRQTLKITQSSLPASLNPG